MLSYSKLSLLWHLAQSELLYLEDEVPKVTPNHHLYHTALDEYRELVEEVERELEAYRKIDPMRHAEEMQRAAELARPRAERRLGKNSHQDGHYAA